MPQDRKALAGFEQSGDTRAKVPLACVVECLQYITMEKKSISSCYYIEK